MAKNYDLFLERMKQKYNVPQTTYKPQTALQKQNALSKNQDTFYNPSQAEQPQEETKDLNWWQKFGAGYQQARTSAETTFLDLGEGVIDAILTGVGAVGEWLGADGLEDTMRDWTQAEWLSTLPQQDWYQNAMNVFGFDFLFGKEAKELARNKEALPEVVDNVASGIGSALGYAALNAVPYVGPALAWMGSGGVAAEEALNEGAGTTEAMLYGGAVGGVEMALEKGLGKALGAVGAGTGKIAGIGKGTSNAAKQVGKSAMSKVISNVGKNFFEEGMEEVVSELVDPLLKKGTYKRDETLKDLYGEQITAESLIETFLVGGLTGGIFEGANIATGIMSSGGVKNWNIRQEAQELQRINAEMEEAILKGDEQKVRKLQTKKDQAIKKVEQKFEEFVKETEANPKLKKEIARAEYEVQRDTTREDLTLDAAQKVFNTKSKKDGTPKINVQYTQDVNTPSQYNAKNNTIYLNKQSLSSLDTALETIAHEAGHAIHTSGLNTDFVNRMTQDFTDFDSLIDNEANKGTVNSIEEMISYYENQKGYGKALEDSNLLKQRMQENKISKEQAYQELRDNYMLEEIANDIFGKKYFSNLLELQSVVAGKKPSIIKRMKEAFRKRFTNTENKPSNYKEVMQIFTDGINQNFDRYVDTLSSVEQNVDKKYKLDEEELENAVDSNGNKLSKEQIEYFKDSAVRDENGNLLVVYHTTKYGGFTIFDPNLETEGNSFYKFEGNVVNFFTDSLKMSQSYGDYPEMYDINKEYEDYESLTYKGYLNITKPLIVEAENGYYNNLILPKNVKSGIEDIISFFESNNDVIKKLENSNYKDLKEVLEEINNELKKREIYFHFGYKIKTSRLFGEELKVGLFNKKGSLISQITMPQTFSENFKNKIEKNLKNLKWSTNDFVRYALSEGNYDGVIIKNVMDYGPNANIEDINQSANVYVSIKNSNQFKEINNQNPTDNYDIRYKLSEKETQPIINEDYDANKNSKFTVNDEEFNIKGISWYEKQLEKLDKINEQYDNEEISENSYYNKIDKINEQVENEINNIEYCLQEFERFDLEEELDINELPTKKDIEKLLNYVYQIENYINNYMDEYDINDADFSEYFDNESAIMQTYQYLSDNQTAESKLKETVQKEPKEKPSIKEEERIKVSKFKSTVKNAYNYFETLLEKYGDVYSAFDEMRGRYHLENWELSFMNEALYQNGKISQEDRDVIVDYLKIKDLDPYKQYQKYLNDGVEVDEQQEKVEEPKVEEQPKTETKKGLSPALQARLEAMKKKKGVSVEEKPKELVFDETSEVQKELLDYKQYDLTEYETKEELVNLGVDLITHIVNLNTGSKSLKTPDEIFSLGNLAKVIEGSTFEYKKSKEAFDIFTKRVNLIKKYHSQLKQVYEKMKNNNIKLGKQAIDDKLLEKMGFISTSYSSKNLSNTINFSTWIEDFNKALSLKEQNKGKVLEKREKVEEQKQEKQKTEEEAQRQRILDINASNVRKQYQDQIKNSLDNYPYEKDNVKDLKDDLDKLISNINYKNYEDYEQYKIDSTKVPKESPIPQIEEKLEKFKKAVKANEESAKKIIDDNSQYFGQMLNLDTTIKSEFTRIGKKINESKYTTRQKINYIDESVDKINKNLIEFDTLLSDTTKLINKSNLGVSPYINDKLKGYKEMYDELNSKLDNLNKKANNLKEELKTKAEEKIEVPKVEPIIEKENKVEPEEKNEETVKETPKNEEQKEKVKKETKKPKTTKPATIEKKVEEKVKIIKSNTIRIADSAKNIKLEADANQVKKYTKENASLIIKLADDMLKVVGKKQKLSTRLQFTENGKEIATQEVFEALNTLANDKKVLVDKLVEIISKGLEIKSPTYEFKNNKVYVRKDPSYQSLSNLKQSMGNIDFIVKIENQLRTIIENSIDKYGVPTTLAKNIVNATKNLTTTIEEQEQVIKELIEENNNLTDKITELQQQVENVDNSKKANETYDEINKINKRINKLEDLLNKSIISNKKQITKQKENITKLKADIYNKSKIITKLTNENIKAATNLEGVFKVTRNERNYINRILKKIGITKKIDNETFERISKEYNSGNIDMVSKILVDYIQNQMVEREYMEYNEETNTIETKTEKVEFNKAYSMSSLNEIQQAFKTVILDRINKGTTKRSALPKALDEIAKLKNKIQIDKETSKKINSIKSKLSSIKELANNKRKSILANNIDKRFKAIGEKLGNFSKTYVLNGDFRATLKELKHFLTEEKFGENNETFEQISGLEFPQELYDQLDSLELKEGQVTIEELAIYDKILKGLKTFIENGTGSRTITIDGQDYVLEDYVKEAIEEQKGILNKIPKEKFGKLLQTVDPRVVFKILSGFNENSKMYKLFIELQRGDSNAMFMEMQLKEKLVDFNKKNKSFKKELNKKISIGGIETTKGKFVSLYKLIKRRNAYVHILKNGIDIDGKSITFSNQDEIIKLKNDISSALEIEKQGSLMNEYFNLTVDFFKMSGETKKIIDEKLYGFSNVEEGEYFPIQISSLDFNKALGEKQYNAKMAASFNYSWLKSITGSGGAVKVGDVQEIIDLHARQVAQYYGLAIPLDTFNQIYSFKVLDGDNVTSLKRKINDRFGLNKSGKYAVEDYLKTLFDDIRGVNIYNGEVDSMFKRIFGSLRKKYSTYVLGANLKVAGVQFAAIPATHKYISLKNMAKAVKGVNFKDYPLPPLGKYRTYDKNILKAQTLNDNIGYVAEFFGKAMTLTDNLTIKYAWSCALYQTNFDVAKATDLFEKIVRETQPNYSAIERSALMRSKNDLVKLLTQFQSQANKNFSTIAELVYKARYYKKMGIKMSKEDIAQFRRSVTSVAMQGVFATALAYLFKFLLNDLDEEDLNVLSIIENFFNDNILSLIPLMNNIKLDLQGEGKLGYIDIYETNLGMIDKLYDAIVGLGNLANPDKELPNKIYNLVNALGIATGIPTENLYKYSIAVLKWFFPNKAFAWDATTKGITMTNKSEINEALQSGKINVAEQYYQTYTSNILELDTYTTKVLFDLYKEGYTNAYIKQVPKTLVVDNEQISVDREKFIKTYSKLTPKLKKLVKNAQFLSLEKEEKEKAISKLVNLYYSLAKKEILGVGDEEYTDLEYIAKYCNDFNQNTVSYLVHISNIEPTKLQTRKELVQRYINSLPLSAGEKYLLFVLSGYSISDKNRNILRSFLSSRGMPTKQINLFLE